MDSKKDIGLLIGIGKPKAENDELGGDLRKAAGRALAAAIKSGDGNAVADAFEELLSALDGDEEDLESEDDSDEEV